MSLPWRLPLFRTSEAAVTVNWQNPIPQTAGVALGTPYLWCYPFYVPSDVTSLQVSVANRAWNQLGGGTFAETISLYTSDGSGAPTGTSLGDVSITFPNDGTMSALSVAIPVTRGSDGKVVLCYGLPGTAAYLYSAFNTYGNYYAGSATSNPLPSPLVAGAGSVMFFVAQYATTQRRAVVLGDSISIGASGTNPVGYALAAFPLIAAADDYHIQICGAPGIKMEDFALDTDGRLWDQTLANNSTRWAIMLGTNDLVNNNAADLRGYLVNVITKIRTLSTGAIYAWTIPPQASYAGTDAQRAIYNADLIATQVALGLAGVYDAAAPSSSVGGLAQVGFPNLIEPTYDAGDGTHYNALGNSAGIQVGWAAQGF